jgi:pSer/pThr/pTyr-binding forkhead associated (FHA) protein
VRYWLFWESRQIALSEGDNLVGRAPDAAIWIDAPGVSRHHARIRIDGAQATVEDLGSKNGTFVGDRQVTTPTRLNDGDRVRFGSLLLTFRMARPADATRTESTSGVVSPENRE